MKQLYDKFRVTIENDAGYDYTTTLKVKSTYVLMAMRYRK